jgi:hypothetical protein
MNSASGGLTSDLIAAMQWLVAAKQEGVNVRVVNDSDTFFGEKTPQNEKSEVESKEIETLGANNILLVTAAGNTGNNNDEVKVQRYPCSYDLSNEICVTADNDKYELPSWANWGPHTVQLGAPGVSIWSTLREGNYGYLTGGSMASPQVAGAAALILSVKETMSATELRSDILSNVDKIASLEGKVVTGGTLDVCKAIPEERCSKPTSVPANTKPPEAVGTPQQGKTLKAEHDEWTNSPTEFKYEWLRCESSGSGCAAIAGATKSEYTAVEADRQELGRRKRSGRIGTRGPGAVDSDGRRRKLGQKHHRRDQGLLRQRTQARELLRDPGHRRRDQAERLPRREHRRNDRDAGDEGRHLLRCRQSGNGQSGNETRKTDRRLLAAHVHERGGGE